MTKNRRKAHVIATAVTAAILSATVLTVTVKAEVTPPAEDAFEKEMEWFSSIDDSTRTAGRDRDLQAENGASAGLAYLTR